MPKTKRRRAAKPCWSESFGFYGATIRAAERTPGGVLYLLWLDNRGKQQKRSLQHRDRKLARKQALEMANAMASTVSPGTARFVTVEKQGDVTGAAINFADLPPRAFSMPPPSSQPPHISPNRSGLRPQPQSFARGGPPPRTQASAPDAPVASGGVSAGTDR
jgi:hypothetical protein